MRYPVTLTALCAFAAQPALAQGEEDEPEEHEALFVIEEAFTQDEGEWQIGIGLTQSLTDGQEREWEAEAEYGITDWLQLEAEFELEQAQGSAEFGDFSLGASYAVTEGAGMWRPEITIRANALFPSGDAPGTARGIGFGIGLGASQQLGERFFAHVSAGYSEAPTRESGSERVEESEWNVGGALAHGFGDAWFVTAEYEFSQGSEDTGLGRVWEDSHTAALGITREFADALVVGLAGALEASDGSQTAQLRALLQFEF